MMRSMLSVLLLLLPLVSAEVSPFFDPKKGVPQQLDIEEHEHHTRRLKELKSIANQRRIQILQESTQESTDGDGLDEPEFDSVDSVEPGFNNDPGFNLGAGVAPGLGFGNGGKGKGGQGKSGQGKAGQGKSGLGKSGQGKAGKKGSKKSQGNGGSSGGSREELEFVLVRNEVGTPSSENDFGVASVLGLNGFVYETTYSSGNGDRPIGLFFGVCTVTNREDGEMLCKYEIYLDSDGAYNMAGLIVNGPVESPISTNIVTGAEYDFERYSGGTMTTLEDPDLPILYVYVELV